MEKLIGYAGESDSAEEDSYISSSSSQYSEIDNKPVGYLVDQEVLSKEAKL
jgi:hypothetical protein